MKFVDEYRDAKLVRSLTEAIARATTRPWTVMEICGGQTHAIVKFGLDELLPKGVTLVHGPGCPVCVTPAELIDQAVELALHHGVILCSFGDMLRVPGSGIDLLTAKARGGDVRIVYSPLDAVALARDNPGPRGGLLRRRDSRRRPPPTRWPSCRARAARASGTFPNSSPTCSSRPRCGRSWGRPTTACRASSPPGTSAS